jgi:hypothetical protein
VEEKTIYSYQSQGILAFFGKERNNPKLISSSKISHEAIGDDCDLVAASVPAVLAFLQFLTYALIFRY